MEKSGIKKQIMIGALFTAVINAVINGIINWFMVKKYMEIPLTDDLISSRAETVFAGAVPLAVSLAFILSTVAFLTFKMPGKPRYFPKVFFMALRNSFFVFGLIVAIAIMLQYYLGTVMVTPVQSAVITGIIAGIVGGVVDYMTKSEICCR